MTTPGPLAIDNLFSVAGKTALVTGGSRGIGEMIASGLVANGATVYISSRKADVCDATAARLSEQYNGTCVSLPADLSTIEGVDSLAAAVLEETASLDILVNNAGVAWGAALGDFPEAGWDKVFDTNVKGVFFLTQALIGALEAAGTAEDPARVINIGSIDGLRAPEFSTYSYGPSKAAVHSMSRQLGKELAPRHINVNAVAPGPYPTWMLSTGVGAGGDVDNTDWQAVGAGLPAGRVGSPEDIAGLAIFLCSRAGAYIVGQTIVTDGGMIA